MDHRISLPATARQIPVARAWARRIAPPSVRDDVELIVSELATNAVRHGTAFGLPGRIVLGTTRTSDAFQVRVTDIGARRLPPAQPADDELLEHGRGLAIVEALAVRSGRRVAPDGHGTEVWAEVLLGPEDREGLAGLDGRGRREGREGRDGPGHGRPVARTAAPVPGRVEGRAAGPAAGRAEGRAADPAPGPAAGRGAAT